MIRILFILLLFASVVRAQYNTITVTFTNIPAEGDQFTRNASTARWTNGPINSTSFIQTNGIGGSATNLWRFLGANNPALYTRMTTGTNVVISGSGLTVAITGTWGYLETNSAVSTNNIFITIPFHNQSETNRTNMANGLVTGITTNAGVAFSETTTALTNHVNLSQAQTLGNKTITNSTFGGDLNDVTITNATGELRNFYASNGVMHTITVTNLNAPGTGSGSQKIGANSVASGESSLALGVGALAYGTTSTALGSDARSETNYTIAVGVSAYARGEGAIALGQEANANATNSIALGTGSVVATNHLYSVALGQATTTESYQIRLGTASHHVSIPGDIRDATLTNSTLKGVNTLEGDLALTPRANTALANGNNAGVVLGTNVYLRLSGASAAFVINGIAAERDGSWHILQIANPGLSCTIANESGTDPTAANRILTSTGGDLVFTNNPVVLHFIYDGGSSRWRPGVAFQ